MVQSLSILFKLKIYINAPSQIFDVGLGFFLEWGSSEKSSVDFSFINYTLNMSSVISSFTFFQWSEFFNTFEK